MRLIIGSWLFIYLLCSSSLLQQMFPGKPHTKPPAREAGRLTADLRLFLQSSKPIPRVSFPLCSKLPAVPALLPHTHLQWTTQILAFKHPSPNSNIYPSPQLQQAFSGNPLTTPAR